LVLLFGSLSRFGQAEVPPGAGQLVTACLFPAEAVLVSGFPLEAADQVDEVKLVYGHEEPRRGGFDQVKGAAVFVGFQYGGWENGSK